MKISLSLAYRMGLFVARLVSGQFKDMAQLAIALENLSDAATVLLGVITQRPADAHPTTEDIEDGGK